MYHSIVKHICYVYLCMMSFPIKINNNKLLLCGGCAISVTYSMWLISTVTLNPKYFTSISSIPDLSNDAKKGELSSASSARFFKTSVTL